MGILGIILVFVVVGLALWAINTYVPMQPQVKNLMNIAVIVLLVVWILIMVLNGLGAPHAFPHP